MDASRRRPCDILHTSKRSQRACAHPSTLTVPNLSRLSPPQHASFVMAPAAGQRPSGRSWHSARPSPALLPTSKTSRPHPIAASGSQSPAPPSRRRGPCATSLQGHPNAAVGTRGRQASGIRRNFRVRGGRSAMRDPATAAWAVECDQLVPRTASSNTAGPLAPRVARHIQTRDQTSPACLLRTRPARKTLPAPCYMALAAGSLRAEGTAMGKGRCASQLSATT
jgi:hypothetical protein